VYGLSTANNGYGVYESTSTGSSAAGVYGVSTSGYGIYGSSTATNGRGVYGVANTGSTASGVYGSSTNGYGVYASGATGVYATGGNGVYSIGTASGGVGVWGIEVYMPRAAAEPAFTATVQRVSVSMAKATMAMADISQVHQVQACTAQALRQVCTARAATQTLTEYGAHRIQGQMPEECTATPAAAIEYLAALAQG
jgi:hypothetical protein